MLASWNDSLKNPFEDKSLEIDKCSLELVARPEDVPGEESEASKDKPVDEETNVKDQDFYPKHRPRLLREYSRFIGADICVAYLEGLGQNQACFGDQGGFLDIWRTR